MGKPRVGLAAKEALLLAVSMHDPRVDEFIIQETNLAKNIISELCKKYEACVAATASVDALVPISTGTLRRTDPADASSAPASGVGNTPKIVNVDSFMRVLRFCAAFVAAASDEGVAGNLSLRSTICQLFAQQFLMECLKSHLLENGEQQVLAAQSLCTYMLQEISSPGCGKQIGVAGGRSTRSQTTSSSMNALRPLTIQLICSDTDLLQAFLPRVGSVSRAGMSLLHFVWGHSTNDTCMCVQCQFPQCKC